MTVYIGVDFHPCERSVAYASDEDGEIGYRRFLHGDKRSIRAFYRKFGEEAVIGTEATGCLWWFEKMLAGCGQKLLVGDPRMIRRAALSRHKNDFRDAETILDLLMRGGISVDRAEVRGEPRGSGPAALSPDARVEEDLDRQTAPSLCTFEGAGEVPYAGGEGQAEASG